MIPNNVNVADNFLWLPDLYKIKAVMLDADFPWYFNDKIVDGPGLDIKNIDYQLTHTFYANSRPVSNFLDILSPVLNKLPVKSLLRVKANLGHNSLTSIEQGFHVDYENFNSTTAIFYMNTNNGYTVFENGTKIESVENRLVAFPSNMLHSGVSCTDTPYRLLININYF